MDRERRNKLLGLGAAGFCGIAWYGVAYLSTGMTTSSSAATPAQIAQVRAAVAAVRTSAVARDEAWRTGLAAAHGTIVPRPDLGPCPVSVPAPPPRDLSGRQEQTWSAAMGTIALRRSFSVLTASELVATGATKIHSPTWTFLDGELPSDDSIASDLGPGAYRPLERAVELMRRAHELSGENLWNDDVTLVADELHWPTSAGDTFTPGLVRGRVYVWSHRDRAVVCAADVTAESSAVVEYSTTTVSGLALSRETDRWAALRNDFQLEMLRAAAPTLVRAGPAPTSAAP